MMLLLCVKKNQDKLGMTDINALTDGIYESKPGGITPPVERGVNLSQYVYLRSARRFLL
nr:hypothetical protein [Salmonella enterica]